MLTLSYEKISENLAEHWGDAYDDPFAREWERLARLTWRALRRRGSVSIAWSLKDPSRRFYWSLREGVENEQFGVIVPCCPRLAARHEDMDRRFPEFLQRYPRFDLRLTMQDVSEDVMAASWPYGYEWELWRWAGGPVEPAPKLVSVKHHAALSRLRARCRGWWVWVDGPDNSGQREWRSAVEMERLVAAAEKACEDIAKLA